MQQKVKNWLKKIGLVGFLFFFIKGLIWLAIFFGLGKWLKDLF
ncbi:hypothetical protein [Aureivirga marina]|nr:hypothetical protein [Aureivirga marina]